MAGTRWRRWMRRGLWAIVVVAVLTDAVTWACVAWTQHQSKGRVFTSVDAVPATPVALVLGAGFDENGAPSAYLLARLNLAKQLYDRGKVRALLVSGDNSRDDYDEPDAMRKWLTEHGVPARKVVADYAGFDTYDSCVRANKIFGVHQAVIVTQTYHVPRAVTLCRHAGVDATGVGDDSVKGAVVDWWQVTFREQFACVKAFYDVTTRRDPVFLGKHETGIDEALL